MTEQDKNAACEVPAHGVVMRLLRRMFTYQHWFLGLALLLGFQESVESGILTLILWQLIRIDERLAS